MNEDRPGIHTVPTELNRGDVIIEKVVAMGSVMAAVICTHLGFPWWILVLPVLFIVVWMLTGEPATDVGGIGWLASRLRSKLGLRRAHEWLLAWGHYIKLVHVPVWRSNCVASWNLVRLRTTAWHRQLNDQIKCRASAGRSWAFRIRSNS